MSDEYTTPTYSVTITITDTKEGNEVTRLMSLPIPNEKRVNAPIFGFEDLNEEEAEATFWQAMKQFRNHDQQKYEHGEYPHLTCEHECSSDCRREGCDCACGGSTHIEKPA